MGHVPRVAALAERRFARRCLSFTKGLLRRRDATSSSCGAVGAARSITPACALKLSAPCLADCNAAPIWQLHNDRLVNLMASADGDGRRRLAMAGCDGSAAQWWRLSDDGQFLGGTAPPRLDDMLLRHTLCLATIVDTVGAQVRGELRIWRRLDLAGGAALACHRIVGGAAVGGHRC